LANLFAFFLVITFEPQSLEGQSRAVKTRNFACFFKEMNKKLPFVVWSRCLKTSSKNPKTYPN